MPHPWTGSIWTYAAYAELLDEAAARDVVLLFPSGLGNSLYTAAAEDEVLRAIDALGARVAIDPARVSIAGASMGGAGATTIGLHHPDRFAGVTSWFGDSRYDLATYVRPILRDEAGAHAVNAADVADNARWVPVWLIHGEDDRVSPIAQSEILARELAQRGFAVRFDRAPGFGHSGALVAKFAREVVARAAEARAPRFPARVTFRSVRAGDRGAYGVTIDRDATGDAYVDIERGDDGIVHVHRADGVRGISLAPGALGAQPGASVMVDATGHVPVTWTR
jgi:pimeloyl-ACP methyl ester carboxylesterase